MQAYGLITKAMTGPEGFHHHLRSAHFALHEGEKSMSESKDAGSWYAGNAGVHGPAAAHHRKMAGDLRAGAGLLSGHKDISNVIGAKAEAHSNMASMHDAGASRSRERQAHWNWMNSPGTDWFSHGLSSAAGTGKSGAQGPPTSTPPIQRPVRHQPWV